jgi:hypothetical protein
MNIIGVDCAAQHKNIGLVKAKFTNDNLHIVDAKVGLSDTRPILSEWAKEGPCLLCIDAPLGWPKPMVTLLGEHLAGEKLHDDGNAFFRRETDLFIKRVYNKNPLDIGADRIARVALSALSIIHELRSSVGVLPLIWSPSDSETSGIIEVYPAATIISHGLNGTGYKGSKPENINARRELFDSLSSNVKLSVAPNSLVEKEDVFDAFICVLAGIDFIEGRCCPPASLEAARQEGWIWVKSP